MTNDKDACEIYELKTRIVELEAELASIHRWASLYVREWEEKYRAFCDAAIPEPVLTIRIDSGPDEQESEYLKSRQYPTWLGEENER